MKNNCDEVPEVKFSHKRTVKLLKELIFCDGVKLLVEMFTISSKLCD